MKEGQQILISDLEALLRPIYKNINRVCDWNVGVLTTGQLRYRDNRYDVGGGVRIDLDNSQVDAIPNTSSLQVLLYADASKQRAPSANILRKFLDDIEYIDLMG
ncbi:MAG: hypothetical protein N2234_08185 [Planctomycetota bacterium]|nr:hypothetical protein [Planctomycetota bacterium]